MSVREKVRGRVQQMRGQAQGVRGQRLGGGNIMEKVKARANQATARIRERKPGIFSKVQEFRPGTRIRQILSPQEFQGGSVTRLGTGISVEAEIPPKVRDNSHIAIEW